MDVVKLVEIMFDPTELYDFLAYSGPVYSQGKKITIEQSSEMDEWILCWKVDN
jgi:hypothetical protein